MLWRRITASPQTTQVSPIRASLITSPCSGATSSESATTTRTGSRDTGSPCTEASRRSFPQGYRMVCRAMLQLRLPGQHPRGRVRSHFNRRRGGGGLLPVFVERARHIGGAFRPDTMDGLLLAERGGSRERPLRRLYAFLREGLGGGLFCERQVRAANAHRALRRKRLVGGSKSEPRRSSEHPLRRCGHLGLRCVGCW